MKSKIPLNVSVLLYTAFFIILLVLILTHSALSLLYAGNGLQLWLTKMIPALLPFMILSGIMIRMELTQTFVSLLHPLFYLVFRVSKNVTYAIVMGFLCGFPMGAKVTADLLERNQITRQEAQFLLTFCNNIGPIYVCSFVLPLLGRSLIAPYLLGMYGVPLLYGLILRYSVYRSMPSKPFRTTRGSRKCAKELILCEQPLPAKPSLLAQTDDAIRSALQSILMLGGYMVLFNVLNLLPILFFGIESPIIAYFAPLLEITGGLAALGNTFPLYSLLVLAFGGLSCMAQTYSMIKNTGISIHFYIRHKLILSALTGLYYFGWFLGSNDTFLR
ncbi:MAG: hypothetical protein LBM69_06185 [Lachnospiraceae bacterium]|jgi:sporulation integral membrane protein YlbJ|nr:hypothetical protein [Lachnospiraceae bacterium]